jgi:tripartite-type tricarboxylate transporter receptor subunit TctC
VVVRRDSPVGSVGDLVWRAKAEPGKVTYASADIGSFAHLSGALFEWRAGVRMVHVPFRGTAPAATDALLRDKGRIRALAARSSDSQSSSVASTDAPLIAALPSTEGERGRSTKVQL